MSQDEIDRLNLNERELKELADEFLKVCWIHNCIVNKITYFPI
jgi:hypothetical protein